MCLANYLKAYGKTEKVIVFAPWFMGYMMLTLSNVKNIVQAYTGGLRDWKMGHNRFTLQEENAVTVSITQNINQGSHGKRNKGYRAEQRGPVLWQDLD